MKTVKRYLILFLALILAAGILACWYAGRRGLLRAGSSVPDDLVLATLDGEPVTYGEFRLHFLECRSAVVSELNSRYGFADSGEYWTTPLPDGTTPLELAVDRTMEKLRAIKARQILFLEYGICEDITYHTFRQQWEAENERRETAVLKGQAVYGPVRFEEAGYFSYIMDQYQNRLEQFFSQKGQGGTSSESPEKETERLVQEKLDSASFRPRKLALHRMMGGLTP